jgi:ABC-type tungstate transport system substrate-binding protein
MRILVVILNIVWLVVSGFLVYDKMSHQDYFLSALFLGTPVVTLIYLFLSKQGGKGWLTLYFQRKALEEKRKIDDLNRTDAT